MFPWRVRVLGEDLVVFRDLEGRVGVLHQHCCHRGAPLECCVNEPDLIAALERGVIAGAGIDTTWEEPLASDSPLWDLENALVTPHTAGETRQYEDNVVDFLIENVRRLQRADGALVNQIV